MIADCAIMFVNRFLHSYFAHLAFKICGGVNPVLMWILQILQLKVDEKLFETNFGF